MIKVGSYIKSTSLLDGSYFENTTIFIVEKNADGAIGFVVNRPFGRSLNELKEFSKSKPFPLLEGGPVDQEHIYVVHSRPDFIKESNPLVNGKYYGGSMQEVIYAINEGGATEKEIQLFLGYCGWDANELEMEIEEGSWTVVSA
jgi:putative transcriptional regulator